MQILVDFWEWLLGRIQGLYKNSIKHNHTLIYLDISISIRGLHQKKLVQFFFWLLPR